MVLGPTVSKIGESKVGGVRSQRNRLLTKMPLWTTELECIQNGLPWRRFVLSECF